MSYRVWQHNAILMRKHARARFKVLMNGLLEYASHWISRVSLQLSLLTGFNTFLSLSVVSVKA